MKLLPFKFLLSPMIERTFEGYNTNYYLQGRQQGRLRRGGLAARAAAADAAHELRAAAAPSPAVAAPAASRAAGPARQPRLQHEGAQQDVRHDGLRHRQVQQGHLPRHLHLLPADVLDHLPAPE